MTNTLLCRAMPTTNKLNKILRRDFIKLSASVAGCIGFTQLSCPSVVAQNAVTTTNLVPDMDYVEKGLNALARAHHMSSMAGHLGASLIAGFYVGKQRPNLNPEVYKGIQGDLEQVMNGESVFGKKMSKKSTFEDRELFEAFPRQAADPSLIDGIAESLSKSTDKPRQSGHNVIFASLALRALKDYPEYATPAVIDGIIKLTNLFANETPGSGYYGKQKGRIYGDKIKLSDDDTPEYEDVDGMILSVLQETIQQKPEIHRVGYGGMVHVINHAAAITDLAEMGYAELAARAIASHRKHLALWRSLPNVADEKGYLPVSKFTPDSPSYWTKGDVSYDRALLTHRVKTMFGFDVLAGHVDNEPKETAAYDKLRLMM